MITYTRRLIPRRPARLFCIILLTLLSWTAGLPEVSLACGQDPPSRDTCLGLNDVTHGSLLFKTSTTGRYIPAPLLKTDVQIVVTGIIARTKLRQ